jgi:integrase/recombinase XerD
VYFERFCEENDVADIAAVTPDVAAAYQSWVYNYVTRFRRPLALSSQVQVLTTVKLFFAYLLALDAIGADPTTVIHVPRNPKRLPANILSSAEMKRLLKQPDTRTVLGFRDRTMLEVFYCCGLRITEAITLTLRSPDLAAGYLTFIGKGGRERTVQLGDSAVAFLREYLAKVRPLLDKRRDPDTLFLTRGGRSFDRSGLLKKLSVYVERAGINKRITVHSFRHTLATEMLRRGADLRYIQEILGHEKLLSTQVYLQIVKEELKRSHKGSHPREKIDLPDNAIRYRGSRKLGEDEK